MKHLIAWLEQTTREIVENIDRKVAEQSWNWKYFVGIFVVAVLIIIIRRVDLVTYPQFWAEDGTVWFKAAYQTGGFAPFFVPVTGYFQTISRLTAALAQLVPLQFAPAVFNVIAIVIKALPVLFLFSNRFQKLIPKFHTKLLIAIVYLCLPNTEEIYANITNAHTFLALLAFMTIIAPKPETMREKIQDTSTYLISGLSGPFVVFLLPIIFVRWLVTREPNALKRYAAYLGTGLVQGLSILLNAQGARTSMTLGATPFLMAKIAVVQVFFASLFGVHGTMNISQTFANSAHWFYVALYLTISIVGIVICIYTFVKAPLELKLLILFATLVFLAALAKPMVSTSLPQWPIMSLAGHASRYWFFPMLAFLLSLLWCAKNGPKVVRVVAISSLCLAIYGFSTDFIIHPWPNLHFKDQAKEFSQIEPGTLYNFPLVTNGWNMELIKK